MEIGGMQRSPGGLAIIDKKAHFLIHPSKILSIGMYFVFSLC